MKYSLCRVQGFGGKYSGEAELVESPKDYISVPSLQSKARQTEQEIVSLSVKTHGEKCKCPPSNGRLICNPGFVPRALPVHHVHLMSNGGFLILNGDGGRIRCVCVCACVQETVKLCSNMQHINEAILISAR